jgi:phosphoribosylglycinamide formyltransferase-1
VRVGVLASGSGTILESLLAHGLPIVVVLADRHCRALAVAEQHEVPGVLVERESFGEGFDRPAFTRRVVEALGPHALDVVAMAGFMTVLAPEMFTAYPGRVLNTHPSLLPSFPGPRAVSDALAHGVKVTGCTVHIATETVDHGPILAQEAVPVLPDDTEAALHERIKTVERRLYPMAIRELLAAIGTTKEL